jgi:Spy/CpxP family protein refolding chaperone
MFPPILSRTAACVALGLAVTLLGGTGRVNGQQQKTHARLPNYFAKVVTPPQADTIRKIQAEYGAKMDALKAQLEALTKQRDAKIDAVLMPEQRKKIEALKAAAKAKRAADKPR